MKCKSKKCNNETVGSSEYCQNCEKNVRFLRIAVLSPLIPIVISPLLLMATVMGGLSGYSPLVELILGFLNISPFAIPVIAWIVYFLRNKKIKPIIWILLIIVSYIIAFFFLDIVLKNRVF